MKLKDITITEFVNMVDSKNPAPGGGSVSALASSLGVALTRMVGHLSVGKKKFRALDENIQSDFQNAIDGLEKNKIELIELIDKDTEAFNLIMAAFKLPKETEEEKVYRKTKIEDGTLEAIKVPMEVALISKEALDNISFILQYGNKNTLSDLAVGALMLAAGIEGAILNVKINVSGISSEETRDYYTSQVEGLLQSTHETRDSILKNIHKKL